ncbi:XRE family transcriptional regulator [Pseudomonas botevensis]|uniref:XRE family transcriptional regulator n=1 Tax=Pseudomonas botevensis TaxID=2842352 RepID=UPI001C3C7B58|nr:XRE family transcriptional regulator [Pseudomonas botevensis]MBV4476516.1 helix-turn-helix domain-containing protein [Pseudomonas botevensis]
MIKIEESERDVYQSLELADAEDMRGKSERVSQLAELIKTLGTCEAEAARKLELSLVKLKEILRGKFREVPIITIEHYINRLSGTGDGSDLIRSAERIRSKPQAL